MNGVADGGGHILAFALWTRRVRLAHAV
jgi:hypothetical protein